MNSMWMHNLAMRCLDLSVGPNWEYWWRHYKKLSKYCSQHWGNIGEERKQK